MQTINPSTRRDSFSVASLACAQYGLTATKRAYTNLINEPQIDEKHKWIVHHQDANPYQLLCSDVVAKESLMDIISHVREIGERLSPEHERVNAEALPGELSDLAFDTIRRALADLTIVLCLLRNRASNRSSVSSVSQN